MAGNTSGFSGMLRIIAEGVIFFVGVVYVAGILLTTQTSGSQAYNAITNAITNVNGQFSTTFLPLIGAVLVVGLGLAAWSYYKGR